MLQAPNEPTDASPIPSAQQADLLKQIQLLQTLQKAFGFHQQGQFDEARALYERILDTDPKNFEALQLLGAMSNQTQEFQRAVECLTAAIDLNPDYPEGYSNRGCAYRSLKQYREAAQDFQRAIALKPAYLDAYYNQGNLQLELKQLDEAMTSFNHVIALKPDHAQAHLARGNVYQEAKQFDKALECYDQAIAHQPAYAEAYNNASMVLIEQRQWRDAIAVGSNALALKPGYDFLRGILQHARMNICDWEAYTDNVADIVARVEASEKVCNPFALLALVDDPAVQLQCATIYAQAKFPTSKVLGDIPRAAQAPKIRVGYYSADFHQHATAYLIAELFEKHDKSKFEMIAFSLGPNKPDEMRTRLQASFDQFLDASALSDLEIAQLSRALHIDIAVDLKGYTAENRTGIFAFRAAPVQVSYLGYPGTSGADFMDYIVADHVVIPDTKRDCYSEQIVYLPQSYQVNDRQRKISDKRFSRAELGLPEQGFVFCCFNKNYKITPHLFAAWMRILQAVDASVLWLFQNDVNASNHLKAAAQQHGIDQDRLVFASEIPMSEHLARHRAADLFLDTLPYNAHTTASDALWAGLPVITLIGSSFASRVSASLLTAIDLPALITTSLPEYEALAIALAKTPDRLQALKQKLSDNRMTTPLFDTPRFTKQLEDAYQQMMARYWAGLAPQTLVIEAA